jgi:hypothetical protein
MIRNPRACFGPFKPKIGSSVVIELESAPANWKVILPRLSFGLKGLNKSAQGRAPR